MQYDFTWDESKTQILGLTPCGRATFWSCIRINPLSRMPVVVG